MSVSPRETSSDLIQTDAAIDPGYSGVSLVNLRGEVISINSVNVAQVGVEGTGYAISIKQAKPIHRPVDEVSLVVMVRKWVARWEVTFGITLQS